MRDVVYEVELSEAAERDYLNQLVWLDNNRNPTIADRFEADLEHLFQRLSNNPRQWQKVELYGQYVRRAVLRSNWIVLYTIVEQEQRVTILRIRGAAEDWTNEPILD